MKILMFGWEFPPHISGGLGTACLGLTRGLSELGGVDLTFVVPRKWGDENQSGFRVVGAGQIPLLRKPAFETQPAEQNEYIEVQSDIIPYCTPGQFWKLKNARYTSGKRFVEVDEEGKIGFSGSYGPTLYREVREYAVVAETLAGEKAYDLIHAHDWLTFPAGIAAKKRTGKPLIIHVHATEFDRSGGDINPQVYAIEREGMEAADKIIAVSNMTRQTIIEKYRIDPGKTVTIYNAVEPLTETEKNIIKKGINGKIVTFLGRITQQKGPEYFVEAARLILQTNRDVHFIMAGSGDRMDNMVEMTARYGLSNQFHFTGFLRGDEVYRILRISDVFVMPSVSEPFGIVPLEAMLSDVPVIISRKSGISEIINYALKVDFWDTLALADAISGVLNYPALSRYLVENGRKEAGLLNWKQTAEEVVRIYTQVLNLHPE